MSNLSNCFAYLGINFYEKEIPENIPKNFDLFIKFIHALEFSYEIFEADFIKKAIKSKCFFIKNWNEEMIYFLVWLISVCEILFYKSFYEFTKSDWQAISNLLPKSDSESLKYRWFTLISSARSPEWSREEDDYLLSILREIDDGNLFVPSFERAIDIKWSKVAMDLSKAARSSAFKTSKQCRERWLNHLDPFLNKETWSSEEDIQLLEESLSKKKRWSEISKFFPGRTQHSVKNRFLTVMGREMSHSRTAIRSLLMKQNNEELICEVLNKLRSRCPANFTEKIETLNEMKDCASIVLKRSQQQMGLESACLSGKRSKFNPEHEKNLINSEIKLAQKNDSTPKMENQENNNLIDMLANNFKFLKECEKEEVEQKRFIYESIFNVDDFFA